MTKYLRWNYNKLYRKYQMDPHNSVLKRAKRSKTYKYIIFLIQKLRVAKFKKIQKKQRINNKKSKRFIFNLYNKSSKKKFFLINKKVKWHKKFLWKEKFWTKFSNSYLKQNLLLNYAYKKNRKRSKKMKAYLRIYRWKNRAQIKQHRKKLRTYSYYKKIIFSKKIKRISKVVLWMKVYNIGRKRRTWWLLRENQKKTAFYFGFFNEKKFRYADVLYKKMSAKAYCNLRLETMINIVLLRLNLIDNIIQSNILLKKTDIIKINDKVCNYPFKSIKAGDTISINIKYFKKMFYMFLKRCKYNKSYLIKRKNIYISRRKIKILRNVVNVPGWIEYNYKIMHFTAWRLPKINEIKGYGLGFQNTNVSDWNVNTKLKYNN